MKLSELKGFLICLRTGVIMALHNLLSLIAIRNLCPLSILPSSHSIQSNKLVKLLNVFVCPSCMCVYQILKAIFSCVSEIGTLSNPKNKCQMEVRFKKKKKLVRSVSATVEFLKLVLAPTETRTRFTAKLFCR